jgi:glycosyltransferase involved in cell wall biosynthesis
VAGYAARLARALVHEGLGVTVVAPQERGTPRSSSEDGVLVLRAFSRGAAAWLAAIRGAQETGAPVIHLQHELFLYGGPASNLGLLGALAELRRGRRASVVTLHQVVDPGSVDRAFVDLHRVRVPPRLAGAGLRSLQAGIGRLATAVVVHEPAFSSQLPGSLVIPHGVDERAAQGMDERARARRSEHAKATLGVRADRLLALCFGYLAPYKGLELALEAAALAGPGVELAVAGGEHPRLEGKEGYGGRLRARYGEVARFVGPVPADAVGTWFDAADVVLLMYPRPFSSSGVLAHALAHKTPLLLSPAMAAATNAPATLEVARSASAVADRLRQLAARPEERVALRQAGQELASGRSWPEVARRHAQVYAEVADGTPAPGRPVR